MMQGAAFWKYSATGNDFMIFDNRDGLFTLEKEIAVQMCKRKEGVGADGVLILGQSADYDFSMSIINADGSDAEMCGNGARAIVHYAHYILKLKQDPHYRFQTLNAVYEGSINGEDVSLTMTEKYDENATEIPSIGEDKKFYINTGVPHAVYHVDDAEAVDVFKLGKKIRHDVTHNNGCNVNFVSLIDQAKKIYRLRTYERGVEDETLCCGTGTTGLRQLVF
jgi:diaminopimelate epimerase